MNEEDSIEINIHIPKSGIFFLGSCIRYAWNMRQRIGVLLPQEKALLDGSLDIEYAVKSFIAYEWMNENPLYNEDDLEFQGYEYEDQFDEEDEYESLIDNEDECEIPEGVIEVLEAQIDELEAQVEELEEKNEHLVKLIEDLYSQLEVEDMLPDDIS